MRPLLLLLGVWHGLLALAATLFGAVAVIEAGFRYGSGLGYALAYCLGGIASVVALTVAAQGGPGRRAAGVALIAPLVVFFFLSQAWTVASCHNGAWFHCLLLTPGAALGLLLQTETKASM